MMKILHYFFLFLYGGVMAQSAQFTPNDFDLSGGASFSGDSVAVLTENELWNSGAIWYKEDIDLTKSFKIELSLWFGCSDGGADGIVFVLHPAEFNYKSEEKTRFADLFPSFGVEMDTYQNFHLGDIHPDHAALLAHGKIKHEPGFTEPIPLHPKKINVENCKYHSAIFEWNPRKEIFTFTFDGIQRIKQEIDLVNAIFQGNPYVFWGLTSTTADRRNEHLVKLERLEYIENEALKLQDQLALKDGTPYSLRQIEFENGSSVLPESAKPELDKLIRFYQKHPDYSMILDVFSNKERKEKRNLELSQERSEAIAKYIISKGFPESNLFISAGGSHPTLDEDQMVIARMLIIKA